MLGCCEDALAVYEQRKDRDKNPRIVRLRGFPFHVYYRSDNYIHNEINSPILPYSGPVSGAPEKFYGHGTYRVINL